MIALEDIFSNGRNKKKERIKYCSKGQKLELISDRGNVLIVEVGGLRFPVSKTKVK